MQQHINEMKSNLAVLRSELAECIKTHDAAMTEHANAWEVEREAMKGAIKVDEEKIVSCRARIVEGRLSPHEMSNLQSETVALRDSIGRQQTLLLRFLAEPNWMKKAGDSIPARKVEMKNCAIRQLELEIARAEVKVVLTDEVLQKIGALYAHIDYSNPFPMNLCADLKRFASLL